jgi:hypothetical protein
MLTYTFKKIALTNKVTVADNGALVMFAHQKIKFKEKIIVYTDSSKTAELGHLAADKVIDFSPTLTFRDVHNNVRFSVKRNGRASIWKANYDINDSNGQPVFKVTEANPWAKVMDSLFGEIPVLGLFAGYLFHVKYDVTTSSGQAVAQIRKVPAFLESQYEFEVDRTHDAQGILPTAILAVLTRERLRS